MIGWNCEGRWPTSEAITPNRRASGAFVTNLAGHIGRPKPHDDFGEGGTMLDFLKAAENLYVLLFLIVPGLVIVYVRSRFISGRAPTHSENALGYLVLSLSYYSIILPLIEQALSVREPWIARAAVWISLTLAGPAVFGLLLGVWAQKQWGIWIADKIGLSTIRVTPASWDWRFSKMPRGGVFVMVTLTSGERVAGLFGARSFASSGTAERDLYLEEEYHVDGDKWEARPAKVGILIPVREVRYVEFWEPYQRSAT
jgi:Family of unknown function (DUF6338)